LGVWLAGPGVRAAAGAGVGEVEGFPVPAREGALLCGKARSPAAITPARAKTD
jgi:hypothetical protein